MNNKVNFKEGTLKSWDFYIGAFLLMLYGYLVIVISAEGIQIFGKVISKLGQGAYDVNGPKFLGLSILNVISVAVLYSIKAYRQDREKFFGFFSNRLGIAYVLMMLFTLFSFTKAINLGESIIHFSKIFTGFTTAWVVSILIYRNPRLVTFVALVMTLLILRDSFEVFKGVWNKISVYEIKGNYSNKNILTSALFVKIPFALWLMFFSKSWRKILGYIGTFCGTLAVFFMDTRAFYMATAITFVIILIYAFISYRKNRDRRQLIGVGWYFAILAVAFSVFTYVQVSRSGDGSRFVSRIKSIADTQRDKSNTQRLDAWKWSCRMIEKDPLLGVGAGNWKVRVLEYENQKTPDYIYMYKNHNDFLEVTAETGIFGGLAFISLFLFMGWYFISTVFHKDKSEHQKMFFLPALGLFAYSFDAFFNFPQDRPELLTLFAIHIGIGVGVSLLFYGREKWASRLYEYLPKKRVLEYSFMVVFFLLSFSSVYALKMNFDSLWLQRAVAAETLFDKYNLKADELQKEFPVIPNLSAVAEPISVDKAKYYIREKRYEDALKVLHADGERYSPWDGRVSYFIGATFYQYENKKYDSIEYYMRKTLALKPKFYPAMNLLQDALVNTGKPQQAIAELKSFLERNKKEPKAWNQLARIYETQKMIPELLALVDSARVYLPNDKDVEKNWELVNRAYKTDFTSDYNRALGLYTKGDYKGAEIIFSQILEKIKNNADIYALRAICNYHLGNYQQAVEDFSQQERLGKPFIPETMNVRAASYYMLKDVTNAKKYFKMAMDKGDESARSNYKKLFGGK